MGFLDGLGIRRVTTVSLCCGGCAHRGVVLADPHKIFPRVRLLAFSGSGSLFAPSSSDETDWILEEVPACALGFFDGLGPVDISREP